MVLCLYRTSFLGTPTVRWPPDPWSRLFQGESFLSSPLSCSFRLPRATPRVPHLQTLPFRKAEHSCPLPFPPSQTSVAGSPRRGSASDVFSRHGILRGSRNGLSPPWGAHRGDLYRPRHRRGDTTAPWAPFTGPGRVSRRASPQTVGVRAGGGTRRFRGGALSTRHGAVPPALHGFIGHVLVVPLGAPWTSVPKGSPVSTVECRNETLWVGESYGGAFIGKPRSSQWNEGD